MNRPTLGELAHRFGTDKQGAHFYVPHYEAHFEESRFLPITLLEIGVGGDEDTTAGGASLRMWKEYFPQGTIVGIDRFEKPHLNEDRLTVLCGDQSDEPFLAHLGDTRGPFDIIIDDGSHRSADVIKSFRVLYAYLRTGGLYVIEDLQTSYWPTFGGQSGATRKLTTMSFLKDLVDGLNYAEYDLPRYVPTTLDKTISSVHFYHNLAFVHKADNTEPSTILPPHPRRQRHFGRVARLRSAARRVIGG